VADRKPTTDAGAKDKTYVGGPADRKPTRAEAEAMAAALWEKLAAPRQAKPKDAPQD